MNDFTQITRMDIQHGAKNNRNRKYNLNELNVKDFRNDKLTEQPQQRRKPAKDDRQAHAQSSRTSEQRGLDCFQATQQELKLKSNVPMQTMSLIWHVRLSDR